MNDFYSRWTDVSFASQRIHEALSEYVIANFGDYQAGARRHRVDQSDREVVFLLDRNKKATVQLAELYADMVSNSADGGKAVLSAARLLFDLERGRERPSYPYAAILGIFLVVVGSSEQPLPGELLLFLRRSLALTNDRVHEVYFGALNEVSKVLLASKEPLRSDSLNAIAHEWEFLLKKRVPAGNRLARVLVRNMPKEWPAYLVAAAEVTWSFAGKENAAADLFLTSTQNIVADLSSTFVASEVWKIEHLLSAHPNRTFSDDLMNILFRHNAGRRPFGLVSYRIEHPTRLSDIGVRNNGPEDARSSFPIQRGDLDRFQESSLVDRLKHVLAPTAVLIGSVVTVYAAT